MIINFKKIAAVIILVGATIGGTAAAISNFDIVHDAIRPYPTIEEFQVVAGMSCDVALESYRKELRAIKRELEESKLREEWAWHRVLLTQFDDVRDALAEVEFTCGIKKLEE